MATNREFQTVQAGERSNTAGKAVKNTLLLSISDSEYLRIRPHLQFVELRSRLILHEPPQKLKYAYFPNSGLISIVVATKGGRDVEAGVVGYEGVAGTPLAVGLEKSPLREVVQIEGNGFKIASDALRENLAASSDLQNRLSRYAVLQGMQVAQTAACNRLHEVAQRLARWLLMAQDRVDAGLLPITHDFLATMLGTDRPSVSLAANALRQNGVIKYNRGSVRILDRKNLEMSACECYRVIQQLNGKLGLK